MIHFPQSPNPGTRALSFFRADSIVRDLELLRTIIAPDSGLTVLGQSFGGFCLVTSPGRPPPSPPIHRVGGVVDSHSRSLPQHCKEESLVHPFKTTPLPPRDCFYANEEGTFPCCHRARAR